MAKSWIKTFLFTKNYPMQKINSIPWFVSKILIVTKSHNVIDQKSFVAFPETSAHTHLKKLHQFIPPKDVLRYEILKNPAVELVDSILNDNMRTWKKLAIYVSNLPNGITSPLCLTSSLKESHFCLPLTKNPKNKTIYSVSTGLCNCNSLSCRIFHEHYISK